MTAKTARILALLILWVLAGAIPALPPQARASAQAPVPQFVPGSRVLVYADPHFSTLRIQPPAGLAGPRPDSGLILVDFATAGTPGPFGGTCQAFPSNAQVPFQYAANIWAGLLTVTVPVHVEACWAPLGATSGILGGAGPATFVNNFPGQPKSNTFYPLALANQLAGGDLNGSDYEILAEFNSDFSHWYFGTDGNGGFYTWDFASVVLHELGHGLGFIGSMDVSGGLGSYNVPPFVYDRFTENSAGTPLLNYPSGSAALASALTSAVYFDGPHAVTANGGARVPLYSPGSWQSGSSYSHLDLSFDNTPNALMTFSLANGEVVHSPGPVTLGILADLGWTESANPPVAPTFLNAAVISSTEIDLSWTDNSAGQDGFQIERSLDGTAWSLAGSVDPGLTTYPDTSLTPGTRYYYRVRAVSGGAYSGYSNIVSAVTLGAPPAPGALTAAGVGETKILLGWKDLSTIETGYLVERQDPGSSTWHTVGTTPSNATSFTDTGLIKATTYTYRVTTLSAQGNSLPADPVSAATWSQTLYIYLPLVARSAQ